MASISGDTRMRNGFPGFDGTSDPPGTRVPWTVYTGDYAARITGRTPPSGLAPVAASASTPRQAESADRELFSVVRAPADSSLEAWAYNFDSTYGARIRSYMARGNYAAALGLYDEANRSIDSSFDDLFAMRDAYASVGGTVSSDLVARIDSILNNPFSSMETTFGGQQTTVDAVLRDGGSLARDAVRDEFESLGLTDSVSEAYFSGDPLLRSSLRGLISPMIGGKAAVSDSRQRKDLAEAVVSGWDGISEVFGNGAGAFVDRLASSHSGTGGAARVLPTLLSVARTKLAAGASPGFGLSDAVLGDYDALVSTVFARDTSRDDASGRPAREDVSPSKRMMFDAVLSSSVAALSERGIDADLSSPAFTRAFQEVLDAQAYAGSLGIDLFAVARDQGRKTSEFGRYVADAVSGVPPTGDNPIAAFNGVRLALNSMVTGGNDFATQQYRMSGNSQDYLASLGKANGGFSSSVGADVMAHTVKSFVARRIAPGIMAGRDAATALADARSGSQYSDTDFTVALSREIARLMVGPGREGAADLIAGGIVAAMDSGRPVSMEDLVFSLAYDNQLPSDDLPESVKCLRTWYNGNVTMPRQRAQKIAQLRAHYRSDEGFDDLTTSALLARVAQEASANDALGRDGDAVYDAALRVGSAYVPMTGPDGRPLVGPAGVQAVERRIVPDRTLLGYDPNGDNTAYMARQRQLGQAESANRRAEAAVSVDAAKKSNESD